MKGSAVKRRGRACRGHDGGEVARSARSKIPAKRALEGVALGMRGEFALIDAPSLAAGEPPVDTALNQRRVARDRNAGNRKACAGALECETRRWRHIAEGILPLHRGARHKHRAVGERDYSGGANAERGIADVLMRAGPCERRQPRRSPRTNCRAHAHRPIRPVARARHDRASCRSPLRRTPARHCRGSWPWSDR